MAANLDAYFDKISKLKMGIRILIFAGTVALIFGAFIWGVYLKKTTEMATIKSDIKKLEDQIRIARRMEKKEKKLDLELAKARQDLQFALRLLPTTSEIPSLLRGITKLGNDSNLEFLLFSPKKQVPRQFYVEIPVSIEVKGGYHDVARFFDQIGKLDRIVNIANVSMVPIQLNSTTLKTSCSALTFRFKEQEKVKSVRKKKK